MKVGNTTAAVVTGGASGLGAATARALAAKGAKVALFDLNAELGERLAAEIGGLFCKVDVTSDVSVDEAFAKARALMEEHQVPVVLEFILERVTNIAMGTEIHNVNEFEEILCLDPSLRLDQISGSILGDEPAKAKAPAVKKAKSSAKRSKPKED